MTDFWVCASCRSLNRGRSKTCYSCHAPYAPYDPAAGPPTAPAATGSAVGPTAGTAQASFPPPPVPIPTAPPAGADDAGLGVAGGLIGGAIGAVLSTALWYGVVTTTHIQAGIVAIGVGWIVGQAVVLAAGRASISLVPVSVAWTLLALVVSQYLIAVEFINELLDANQFGIHLPILAGPADVLGTVWNWIQYDPLTLVFWAIALFESVAIPWRRTMRGPTTRWPGLPGSSRPAQASGTSAATQAPVAPQSPATPGSSS